VISSRALSRIENGKVSPTASVLGRLAGAHGSTVSRLLADIEGEAPALVARANQLEWVDPATGFRRRSVSPPSADFDCEILRCELPAGASIDYPLPPRLGLEHHLYLEDGALELTIEGKVHRLTAGDCLRYKLTGPSRFRALGRRPARYILVLR
jgi:transcriptional regulator with XRE-family HTH domain